MNAALIDVGQPETCQPLTCTRPLAACPVANQPLGAVQKQRLAEAQFAVCEWSAPALALYQRGDAWLSLELLRQLAGLREPTVIRDALGDPLAWINTSPALPAAAPARAADAVSFRIRYPWDLLAVNEQLVAALPAGRIEGEVSPAAQVEGTLALGPGSRLLPGVFIEGQVIIGANTKVGPNCYLRGRTSIGDNCHIGQAVEIKNSIVMNGAGIGHLSYCGDSIIGEKVNFGAGTITSNLRHDGANHRSLVRGELVETGRRKLGAVVGDGAHTGIHTSIYPGRKIWPGQWTRPGEIVRSDLREENE